MHNLECINTLESIDSKMYKKLSNLFWIVQFENILDQLCWSKQATTNNKEKYKKMNFFKQRKHDSRIIRDNF